MEGRIIIIGAGLAGKTIASAILKKGGMDLVGVLDDNVSDKVLVIPNGDVKYTVPIIGTSNQLHEVINKHHIRCVVIAAERRNNYHLLNEIVRCYQDGITVYEMPELYSRLVKKVPVKHVDHEWIVPNLTEPPHDLYTFFHDAMNYILAIIGLFVALPVFPLISLAIKLDSKGPIFYKQQRLGKNNKPFTLIKFRTMVADADIKGDAWTKKGDERITRIGRWLRKFRLDELPQLFNVLKRNMALIGPRPDAIDLVAQFRKEIPFYDYRHLVRPGITGWAQINHGNTCTVEGAIEKLQYDLYWIKNRSFWLDLKIIFKSIKVMLTGYGAV
jgi:exopolysaccharide biosynthesis polyprenyl glycosylphosphotransferase